MVSHPVATTADNNTDLIRVGQGTHRKCAHSQPSTSNTHKHTHAHMHLIAGLGKGDVHSGGKMTYSKVRKSTLSLLSSLSHSRYTCVCVFLSSTSIRTFPQVNTFHVFCTNGNE